jgi:hypothetical protein
MGFLDMLFFFGRKNHGETVSEWAFDILMFFPQMLNELVLACKSGNARLTIINMTFMIPFLPMRR